MSGPGPKNEVVSRERFWPFWRIFFSRSPGHSFLNPSSPGQSFFNFSHRYKMKMLDSLSCSTDYGELIPNKSSKKSKWKALKMHY